LKNEPHPQAPRLAVLAVATLGAARLHPRHRRRHRHGRGDGLRPAQLRHLRRRRSIEWKAGKWISDRLGDKVHVNATTAFNRKLLLTGEAFNEEPRGGPPRHQRRERREVINELRVAPTSSLGARANDSYISSKVKARFVDQKDFHVQQVKVVTEAGTTYLLGLVSQREGRGRHRDRPHHQRCPEGRAVFEYIGEEEARRLDGAAESAANERSQHHEPT
jgi:hypothetical protein